VAEKPENGADLAVQKKGDYPSKKLFLNVEVYEKEFLPDKKNLPENFYLLAVNFDFIKQELEEKIWFLPAFKEQINKETFVNFLIQKLIAENKPKSRKSFKPKVY
jgi:hypothetical protein